MTHLSLRDCRIEASIPQFDLSNRSGVDRSRLSLYECGHISLRAEEVAALEKALRDLIGERASRLITVLSSFGSQSQERQQARAV
jgi:transcriptional regulator with XRE-family HTH domain